MNFKLAFEGSVTNVVADMKAMINVLEKGNGAGGELSIAEIKGKRGRKPKEVEETEELEETPAEEESEEIEESEELEEETEADTISESDLAKLKGALKAYAGKHSKDAAIKALHKFAKKSSDVKPADLPKLLKALKV